jgi:hypothetical protein
VCLPIAVVEIDSSCAVNKIHATHFWETALSTLANFIDCRNGSDIRIGASTLDGGHAKRCKMICGIGAAKN